MFCKQDRALRAEPYDGQITAHLMWHNVLPQTVGIQDSWRPVDYPRVRFPGMPRPLTRVQDAYAPLLAKLRAGGLHDLFTTPERNNYKRSYCLVRSFLGIAAELGDMPSQLEVQSEELALQGAQHAPQEPPAPVYYDEDPGKSGEATQEAGEEETLGEGVV